MNAADIRLSLLGRDPGSLTDAELLTGLLAFCMREVAAETADRLLERFGSLTGVCLQEPRVLEGAGLSESTACLLAMILPAYGRARLSEYPPDFAFNTLEKLGRYFSAVFCGDTVEKAYLLLLNEDHTRRALRLVAVGSVNSANLNTRAIVETALFDGARYVVFAHNHPVGDPTPSASDIATTTRLRLAFESIGVGLLEHIVTAGERYAPVLLSCRDVCREAPPAFYTAREP